MRELEHEETVITAEITTQQEGERYK